MIQTLLFLVGITLITTFPFIFIIGGVMVLRWAMARNRSSASRDDE